MEEFMPIVYCCVCVTPHDADGFGPQSFVCSNCETEFSVTLEADKIAQHAMTG